MSEIWSGRSSGWWWVTRVFRFYIGPRMDMMGEPWGLLLLWRPRPDEPVTRFAPIPVAWSFGIWFLSPSDRGGLRYWHNWRNLFPRFQWSPT